MPTPELHVLRVFVAPGGGGGNPLGMFVEDAGIPADRRQAVAADLGFSETVFVEDAAEGTLRIFTPTTELPFAGHPLVGTSWLLAARGRAPDVLRPPAGRVPTWSEGGLTWIRGRPEWAPAMTLERHDSPAAVDALDGPPEGVGFLDAWSWEDKGSGAVRARVFAPAVGITEDEATGAAAVRLAAALGRPLRIRQGRGSVLHARPGPDGTVDLGGEVAHVAMRAYRPPR